ncbi:MAG: hypothetical protein EXX96DRAFT_607871 [Benjaminiella poitrasii]|nr:MAG: hypothetical protein EXX96DRAFT_607871 [Benjaminiella poitrasii]
MLRTICTAQLPLITRLAPKIILTRLPITLFSLRRNHTARSIFDSSDDHKEIEKKHQLPDDKPWNGEEPVQHSVLRMIMDKYRAPLRVEGAARRNMPKPQSDYVPPPTTVASPDKDKSAQIKKQEREQKQRESKQRRILNAKDSAFDYAMEKKYLVDEEKSHVQDTIHRSITKKDIDWEDWDLEPTPRSINEIGLLSDERIRAARARGEFDDLPGRGKPLPDDPLINNPFIDRTEYFLNRIIQRNGAAPPWVIMQQEVDTEISTLRSQMNSAFKRCMDEIKQEFSMARGSSLRKQFEKMERTFFDKEVNRINKRLRSYNVMCPSPARKPLLELEKEIKVTLERYGLK